MKKSILIAFLLLTATIAMAHGTYHVKYTTYALGEKTALRDANVTITLSETRVTAYNTSSGTKYWESKYQGIVMLPQYNNFRFHKYYLTNLGVYFYISEQKVFAGPNNTMYYMIDFAGEIQFAL